MKGLAALPAVTVLQKAYAALQGAGAAGISEADLALWSQWCRLDPRLAEIWVGYLARHWRDVNPAHLNHALRAEPWPAAAGPLLEMTAAFGVPRTERLAFRHWKACALTGLKPAAGELYFIGIFAFAGRAARREAERPTLPYSRWGYAGTAVLINKAASSQARTLLTPGQRRSILGELLDVRPRITVTDYLEALGGQTSRRVAEMDLAQHADLRRVGRTRSAFYRRVPRKARR